MIRRFLEDARPGRRAFRVTTYRTATRTEVLDLLKEDHQDLRHRDAHRQEHWREGRLLFDWISQTIQAIEQKKTPLTNELIQEWRARRSGVFTLPVVLSRAPVAEPTS